METTLSSFAETIFVTSLSTAIPEYAPGVNATAVIAAGASSVRVIVPKASLHGVLLAYNEAITHVFVRTLKSVVDMIYVG